MGTSAGARLIVILLEGNWIFEFTIVTAFSLCTTLETQARGAMMAGFLAAAGCGRVVGALTGGPLWLISGVMGVGLLSALLNLLALAALLWGFKGWRPKELERKRV